MRRTKAEAEQTRQDVLDAAVTVFYEDGVARASLDKIAKTAGVTRGAIYWHFKNKFEVFEALHERLHTPFLQQVIDQLAEAEHDPLKALQEFSARILIELAESDERRRNISVFFLRCDYTGEWAPCKATFMRNKARTQQAMEQFFVRAQQLGALPKSSNPKLLTVAYDCYLKGIVMEYLDSYETFDLANQAHELMELFFKQFRTTQE